MFINLHFCLLEPYWHTKVENIYRIDAHRTEESTQKINYQPSVLKSSENIYIYIQGVQTKLSRTLGPHCGWTNYRSITCSINSESYTHVLSIFTLVVFMPSSYEDLEGFKWEEVDLRSAADFMTKLSQSP